MVKFGLTSVLLFCAGLSFAQVGDTTCIQTRWTLLYPTAHNAKVFGIEKKPSKAEDMFLFLKELSLKNKLQIYMETVGTIGYETAWESIEDSTIHNNRYGDPLYTTYKKDIFNKLIYSNMPLVKENGDPVIATNPDGTQEFVYPPPDSVGITMHMIQHLRIREELIVDESGNADFQLTGIGFYFNHGNGYGEVLFWISFFELREILKKQKKPNWYKALENRNYSGFQYMQKPCNTEN